ncbi:MAG: Ig-like domain-containing protein [candidate division KSB1 bacterium]|nr:Ig-like domain-containing protein [candidate division KSB1 bacterium]MDZ7317602.1 Ig-like domain-containing protein [candidate division KSB1 bacterium]MDZ7340301.1 Ig-like domain-containing protein [candidate division KSB1 bacterium]
MKSLRFWKIWLCGWWILIIGCTEEQPYSPEIQPGQIVGIVKPSNAMAKIELVQGVSIQATTSDSSGYYKFNRVTAGTYNLHFSAINYGRQELTNIVVYPNRITAVPDVYLKPIPEQIATTFPLNNTVDFPLTAPVQIEFQFLMNQPSVEANFALLPPVSGHFSWAISNGKSIMSFQPDDQYVSNFWYQAVLYKNAQTIYGDNLAFDYWINFKTETATITSTVPQDGATFVSPQTAIYLYFNSAMDRPSVEQNYVIFPAKLGSFKWLDSRRLIFQPGSYLASSTIYQIAINPGAVDVFGTPLSSNNAFSFKTEPLMITSSFPVHGATAVSRSTPITVTFNTLMNQVAAQQAFSISPLVSGWNFQWSDLSRFQYFGTSRLEANTFYTVTIDTTCSDAWGNRLPANFSFIFKTGE